MGWTTLKVNEERKATQRANVQAKWGAGFALAYREQLIYANGKNGSLTLVDPSGSSGAFSRTAGTTLAASSRDNVTAAKEVDAGAGEGEGEEKKEG